MLKNTLGNKLNWRSCKFEIHFASFLIGEHNNLVKEVSLNLATTQ